MGTRLLTLLFVLYPILAFAQGGSITSEIRKRFGNHEVAVIQSGLSDGQVLSFNATSGKWEAANAPAGGGAGVTVTADPILLDDNAGNQTYLSMGASDGLATMGSTDGGTDGQLTLTTLEADVVQDIGGGGTLTIGSNFVQGPSGSNFQILSQTGRSLILDGTAGFEIETNNADAILIDTDQDVSIQDELTGPVDGGPSSTGRWRRRTGTITLTDAGNNTICTIPLPDAGDMVTGHATITFQLVDATPDYQVGSLNINFAAWNKAGTVGTTSTSTGTAASGSAGSITFTASTSTSGTNLIVRANADTSLTATHFEGQIVVEYYHSHGDEATSP